MAHSPIITTPGQAGFESEGSYVVGTLATFFYTFTDITGNLYDPSDLTIEIAEPDGTVVTTGAGTDDGSKFDKIELGVFSFTWNIPSDATTGKYSATLTYVVERIDGPTTEIITEYFIVIEGGQGSATLREVATRRYVEFELGYIQRIPIFEEPIRFNLARTTGRLSFPRWNQTAGVEVFVNGNPKETGFTPDYLKGRISFANAIFRGDQVDASYNFRWFTDEELDSFIEQGVNIVNLYPPQTTGTINNIADRWVIVALHGAIIFALRRWMADVQFQEPAKIFGSMERAQQVFGNWDTLKKDYESMFDKMLEQKKYGPYVGLTKTLTTPEFTLPGGRSRWFRYLFKGA